MPATDFRDILRILTRHGVRFVVVGGVGAVLQGAPVHTFDLDVVHQRDEANVERLLRALEELDACYRIQPERRLKPTASHLSSAGHQLLMTRHGPLDLLGEIGRSQRYEDLEPRCAEMEIGDGVRVLVADLQVLIETKEAAGSEKDQAVLPVLRRTLEERSKG
jgi:hypothetical protein